jgi:hypothetical protein
VSKRLALLIGFAVAILCGAGSGGARIPVPCGLILKYGVRSEKPPGHFHVDLVFLNSPGGTSCRVSGFPDVKLIGPTVYAVRRQAARSQALTLRPGESAHAVLTWASPSRPGDRFVPVDLRVLVPSNRQLSSVLVLHWRYGPVLRGPGTYVGPLRPGAH